jgi:hypothetical protein
MPPRTTTKSTPARRRAPGHIDSYEEGRTCGVDGCTTLLSRYNSATTCSAHQKEGRRPI